MSGAVWTVSGIALSSAAVSTGLDSVVLAWKRDNSVRATTRRSGSGGGDGKNSINKIGIPVYLNADRADILFVADVAVDEALESQVVQQAVALVAA